MRKLILAGGIALAVIVATVLALASAKQRVEAALEGFEHELAEQARFELRGETVRVSYLPRPAVVIEGASLRAGKKAGAHTVAEGGRVRMVPRLAPLLLARAEIDRVELDGVHFTHRVDADVGATALLGAVGGGRLPIRLRDCTLHVDRGTTVPPLDVDHIDVDLTPGGGALAFAGTLSPLGERSQGRISGEWRPGAGSSGGDGLSIHVQVRRGDPQTLVEIVPPLARATFTEDVQLDYEGKGFIGDRGTESRPAQALLGHVHAEVGLNLLGHEQRAVFDSGLKLDDQRFAFDSGQGHWGDREFKFAGWIARGVATNKVGLRLSVADVDVASVLADYGIDARWHPQAKVTGEIRVDGSLDYLLGRYEAKAPSVTFDGWPGVPVSAAPVSVSGTLLAINADVAASFLVNDLHVADVTTPEARFGVRWWRDELTVTSLDLPIWGGKLDGSASYKPLVAQEVNGGAMLSDVDASKLAVPPLADCGQALNGRVDLSWEFKYSSDGWAYDGRVGVHEGSVNPSGVLTTLVDSLGAKAGGAATALPDRPVLHTDKLPVHRVAVDFRSQGDGLALRIDPLLADGVSLVFDGTVDGSRRLNAQGAAVLTPPLSGDLARVSPALAKLTDTDGSLEIPIRVDGPCRELHTTPDPQFQAALDAARAGKEVAPSRAPPPPRSFEVDLPSLEEQFAR